MKSVVLFMCLSMVYLSSVAYGNLGAKLFKKCMICHGENGEGKLSQKAPLIAGQFDWYILKSLNDFKSGVRKNPAMLPYIKKLSELELQELASYISKLKVK